MWGRIIAAVATALVCASASAEVVLYQDNRVGGKIVLTNEPCFDPSRPTLNLAFNTVPARSATTRGCWAYNSELETVFVLWEGGGNNSYPIDSWVVSKSWEEKLRRRMQQQRQQQQQPQYQYPKQSEKEL